MIVKDLDKVVTKGNITAFIPVAQSPLAARTQKALTFSSDLTTDVNNILISHETIHAASCSGQSDDLVRSQYYSIEKTSSLPPEQPALQNES